MPLTPVLQLQPQLRLGQTAVSNGDNGLAWPLLSATCFAQHGVAWLTGLANRVGIGLPLLLCHRHGLAAAEKKPPPLNAYLSAAHLDRSTVVSPGNQQPQPHPLPAQETPANRALTSDHHEQPHKTLPRDYPCFL